MSVFFEWLDAHPPSYWVIAWTSLALCGLSAWLPKLEAEGPGWRRWASHPAVFASLVFLTLCAFRWPSWFEPKELNPDESQIIAGAITLRDNPVFWKSVDGTTHGPLNEYILTAASLVGVPLNYLGARLMAALLIAGACSVPGAPCASCCPNVQRGWASCPVWPSGASPGSGIFCIFQANWWHSPSSRPPAGRQSPP
jgi:hypothetical protein